MQPKQSLSLPVYMERHKHPDVYLFRKIWDELDEPTKKLLCVRLTNLSYYGWLVRLDKPLWFRTLDLTAASVAVMYLTAGYSVERYMRKTRSGFDEAITAMTEYLNDRMPTTISSELTTAAMVVGAGNLIYEGKARLLWRFSNNPNVCKLPVVCEHFAYLDHKSRLFEQHAEMRQLYAALEKTMPYANVSGDYLPQVILWQ